MQTKNADVMLTFPAFEKHPGAFKDMHGLNIQANRNTDLKKNDIYVIIHKTFEALTPLLKIGIFWPYFTDES